MKPSTQRKAGHRHQGAILAAMLALGALAPKPALADNKPDPALEAAAKCAGEAPMAPSLLAYRLLLNSTAVVRAQKGPTSTYVGAVDPSSGIKVWGLKPTRIVVVERAGVPFGMVGSLYSADYPLSVGSLVDSFKGGLKRKIELGPFSIQGWSSMGLESAQISKEPVFKDRHLMVGAIKNGEHVMMCASLAEFAAFTKQ